MALAFSVPEVITPPTRLGNNIVRQGGTMLTEWVSQRRRLTSPLFRAIAKTVAEEKQR